MQTVNGLEQARAALRAGVRELLSPPFAGCHAGVGYYQALIEQLVEEFPDTKFTFTVCCGTDAAIAHDALRLGLSSIVFEGPAPMQEKLSMIAHACGAKLLQNYPQNL